MTRSRQTPAATTLRELAARRMREARQGVTSLAAAYTLIHERRQLVDRPWEEDLIHISRDGELHGHIAPPNDGRRHSVTSDGWCPGWAREHARPSAESR